MDTSNGAVVDIFPQKPVGGVSMFGPAGMGLFSEPVSPLAHLHVWYTSAAGT